MKKERIGYGMMLVLILNWMMHNEITVAVYFSVVITGLLVFYRSIYIKSLCETSLVRFVIILLIGLCFQKEIQWMEALGWMMICVASSAYTQRIQQSESVFLDQLSMFNMILMPFILLIVIGCIDGFVFKVELLMVITVLFQPSGLPLVSPLECFTSINHQ